MKYKINYQNFLILFIIIAAIALYFKGPNQPNSTQTTPQNAPQQTTSQNNTQDSLVRPNQSQDKSKIYWETNRIKVDSVLFFENGETFIYKGNRTYLQSFLQPTARYISWELNLSHQPIAKDTTVVVNYTYYEENGTVMGNFSTNIKFAKNATATVSERGWGWGVPGNWHEGNFRAKIFVSDSLIATANFKVVGLPKYAQSFRVNYYGNSTEELVDYAKRAYRKQFSRKNTQLIGWELHYELPAPLLKDLPYFIEAKCIKPSGGVLSSFFTTNAKKDLTHTWAHDKWTWDSPQQWQQGKYKTEFYINKTLVAVDEFSIVP